MTSMPATLFHNPLQLSSSSLLWLLLPLWLGVAIVYKTIRTRRLPRLAWEIIGVFVYLMAGSAALAVALWLVQEFFA